MTKKITIDDDMVRRAIREGYGALASGTDMFHKTNMDWYRRVLDTALNPPHEHTWSVLRAVLTSTGCREISEVCPCGDRRTRIEAPCAAFPSKTSGVWCHQREKDLVSTSHYHLRSADRKPDSAYHIHKRSSDPTTKRYCFSCGNVWDSSEGNRCLNCVCPTHKRSTDQT